MAPYAEPAALRNASSRLSTWPIWFQLANVWLTNVSNTSPDARVPGVDNSYCRWPRRRFVPFRAPIVAIGADNLPRQLAPVIDPRR
jgi:hypothetical protein